MRDNEIIKAYSIKEVSRKINVPSGTIRQWEKDLDGLLVIPRSNQGARFYTKHEIEVLEKVKQMRAKNVSKDMIRSMLEQHLEARSESFAPLAIVPAPPLVVPIAKEDFFSAMESYRKDLLLSVKDELRQNRDQIIAEIKTEITTDNLNTIKSLSKSIHRSNQKTGAQNSDLKLAIADVSERTSETLGTLSRRFEKASEGNDALVADLSSSIAEARHTVTAFHNELERHRLEIKEREDAFQHMVLQHREVAATKKKPWWNITLRRRKK